MKSFDRQMDNVETLTEKLACGLDQTLVYMFYRLGACDGKITCTLSWLFEKYVVHSTDELIEKLKTIPGVLILNLYGSDTIVHVEMDQFAKYLLSEIGQELPDIDCHSINDNLTDLGKRIDDLSDRLEKSLSMNKSGNKSIDKPIVKQIDEPSYIINETPIEMLRRLTISGAIMHTNKEKDLLFDLSLKRRNVFQRLCELSKSNAISLFDNVDALCEFLDNNTIQGILHGTVLPRETYKAFILYREMFGNMLRIASPEALCRIINEYTVGREEVYLEFIWVLDRYNSAENERIKQSMMREILPFVDAQYVADTIHIKRLEQMRKILMEHLGYVDNEEQIKRKIHELNSVRQKIPVVDRSVIASPQPATYKTPLNELNTHLYDLIEKYEGNSVELGQIGEECVYNVLSNEFDNVDLVSHKKHVGDIHCENILVEVKNHGNTVALADKVKFYRDMRENPDMIGGIIVSLKSDISRSDPLDVGITPDGRYIIYLSNPTLGILLASVKLLFAGENIPNRKVYVKEIEKYMPYDDGYDITKLSIAFTGDSTKLTYG